MLRTALVVSLLLVGSANAALKYHVESRETAEVKVSAAEAAQAFEMLKRLSGNWKNRSTKDWTGTSSHRVMARGSVIMMSSEFDDTSDAGMAVMFFMDRGRLKLTHYCEAGNQPTLVLSSLADGGKKLMFTFESGTGMESRDKGHMDSLVLTVKSDDSFVEHWTWYQNGKAKWLEEITNERARQSAGLAR
jgi:hypothetical protein